MPRRSTTNDSDELPRCGMCSGTGQVEDPRQPLHSVTCPACGGMGRVARGRRDVIAVRDYQRLVRAHARRP